MPRFLTSLLRAGALSSTLLVAGGCLHDPVARQEAERREAFDLLTEGQELKDRGDYLLARDKFIEAVALSDRPVLHYEIGNCYYRLGNYEQAAVYYEKALAMAPDYSLARAELDLVRAEMAAAGGRPSVPAVPTPAPAVVAEATQKPPAEPVAATPVPPVATPAAPVAPTPIPPAVMPDVVAEAPRAPAAPPKITKPVADEVAVPDPVSQPTPVRRGDVDPLTEPQRPQETPVAVKASEPAKESPKKVEPARAEEALKVNETGQVAAATTTPDAPADEKVAKEQESPAPDQSSEEKKDEGESTEESEPAEERKPTSPFGALASPFSQMSGSSGKRAKKEAPGVDEVRQLVFPELDESQALTPEAEAEAARQEARMGRHEEAARRWSRVLVANPADARSRLELAKSLARSGRTRRAEEEFFKAVSFAPDDPEVHFEQGNFYVETRELGKAKACYDRALELDGGHLRARNNLAALHLEQGNPGLALTHLEEVVRQDPQFASGWLNLALAREDTGAAPSETLEALETYLRLNQSTDARSEKWLRELREKVAGSP